MYEKINKIASCLCNKTKIHIAQVNPQFTVCHCKTCRKWAGGPLFMMSCGTDVHLEGQDHIKEYDSSPWATRGFCTNCGTHLFSRFKEAGSYNIPVGLLPETKGLTMSMQYFSDLRPSYYCFSNKSPEMTEAEILKHFNAK